MIAASSVGTFRRSNSAGRSVCPIAGLFATASGEVRSNLAGGRIARVIFCITGSEMVLLHGFIKKSQKTSAQDLSLALSRKREIGE